MENPNSNETKNSPYRIRDFIMLGGLAFAVIAGIYSNALKVAPTEEIKKAQSHLEQITSNTRTITNYRK